MKIIFYLFSVLCLLENELIEEINKYRLQRGLAKLEKSDELTQAAQVQATYMRNTNTLTHFNTGKNHTLLQRIQNAHYDHLKFLGQFMFVTNDISVLSATKEILDENARTGYLNKDFEHIGLGHAQSKTGRTYWVVVFASKFDKDLISALM